MKRKSWVLVPVLAFACATPALAADNGIYIGAGIGYSNVDVDNLDFGGDATGYKIIAGWRFLDWLSVEGNYVAFGNASDLIAGQKVKTDIDGYSLSALGFLPVGPVDLFARAGIIDWNAKLSSSGFTAGKDDGTDFAWGLGAQFRLGSLALRAEYEQFDLGQATTNMITAAVTWTFF